MSYEAWRAGCPDIELRHREMQAIVNPFWCTYRYQVSNHYSRHELKVARDEEDLSRCLSCYPLKYISYEKGGCS